MQMKIHEFSLFNNKLYNKHNAYEQQTKQTKPTKKKQQHINAREREAKQIYVSALSDLMVCDNIYYFA